MRYCPGCDARRRTDAGICPACGEALEERAGLRETLATLFARSPDWEPRLPRLSVAASILLLWAAAHTLPTLPGDGLGLLFFLPAGVLILPRVRLALGRLGGGGPVDDPTAGDWLTEAVVVVLTGIVYLLLLTAAWLVLGYPFEGTLVPGSPVAPVQALVAGAVVVGATRFLREFRTAGAEDAASAESR